MKRSIEKNTCQKKAILDFLKSVKTHPTAEEVYRSVKEKLPQISRGTVYRNLNLLADKGEILEIFSKVSHYDGYISPHAHFVCRECDKIFDISDVREEYDAMNKFIEMKGRVFGKIQGYHLIFYGFCRRCKNKTLQNKKPTNFI